MGCRRAGQAEAEGADHPPDEPEAEQADHPPDEPEAVQAEDRHRDEPRVEAADRRPAAEAASVDGPERPERAGRPRPGPRVDA